MTLVLELIKQRNPPVGEPLVKIMAEVTDILSKLEYYAEKWRQGNAITRKQMGSKVRSKIMLYASSISNYKMLIEAVCSCPTGDHDNERGGHA